MALLTSKCTLSWKCCNIQRLYNTTTHHTYNIIIVESNKRSAILRFVSSTQKKLNNFQLEDHLPGNRYYIWRNFVYNKSKSKTKSTFIVCKY